MGIRIVPVLGLMAMVVGMVPAWGQTSGAHQKSDSAHHVVMHLNSGDERIQKSALNNIAHLFQEVGGDRMKVELVVHGAGLELLTKKHTKFLEELERLKSLYGVSYTACSNTMKSMNLTRDDLIAQVDRTVPAMVRLMELQEAGWVYIKP